MDHLTLHPGSIAVMSSCEVIAESEDNNVTRLKYGGDRKRRMVFLYLGTEPADRSSRLDPIEVLKALGMTMPADMEVVERGSA